jgi:hypothetical protein
MLWEQNVGLLRMILKIPVLNSFRMGMTEEDVGLYIGQLLIENPLYKKLQKKMYLLLCMSV